MKLITHSDELVREFKRLMSQYDNFFWAAAWASSGSIVFNELLNNKSKINKLVIGIHFYQTHPDFIEAFLNNNSEFTTDAKRFSFYGNVYYPLFIRINLL